MIVHYLKLHGISALKAIFSYKIIYCGYLSSVKSWQMSYISVCSLNRGDFVLVETEYPKLLDG